MWEKETYMNKSILDLLLTLSIGGGLIVLFLLASASTPTKGASLYFKPDSYSNYVNQDAVTFVFGLQNHENSDKEYLVKFYVDDQLLRMETVKVRRNSSYEENRILEVNAKTLGLRFPTKLRVLAFEAGKPDAAKYVAFYWLKAAR